MTGARRPRSRLPTAVSAALLLVLAAAGGEAMPVHEPQELHMADAGGELLTVRGTLARYGNEPHTYLGVLVHPDDPPRVDGAPRRVVVLAGETVFRLQTDDESELNRLQGSTVEASGVLERAASTPGLPPTLRVRSYTVNPPAER